MYRVFLLILGTAIWGLGFVGTRWTFMEYSPIWSNSLRFLFAGLIVLPFILKKMNRIITPGVIICSLVLAVSLQLQTMGIELTTLAKSGFITVFYALITPVLTLFIYKRKFRPTYWLLLSLSMLGIAMLCELSLESFNRGDAFILASALGFSLHILAIDYFAQKADAIEFNFAQCVVVGAITVTFALIVEGPVSLAPLMQLEGLTQPSPLWGFIILSVLSSIIAFTLQVYAQQGIPPHIVSLIFLMESIFASAFGYLLFRESLNSMQLAGCALVLISVALVPRFTRYEK